MQNKEEPPMTSTRPTQRQHAFDFASEAEARRGGAPRGSIVRGGHGEVGLGLTLGRSDGASR